MQKPLRCKKVAIFAIAVMFNMSYLLHLPDNQGLTSTRRAALVLPTDSAFRPLQPRGRVCFKVKRQHLQEAQEQQHNYLEDLLWH